MRKHHICDVLKQDKNLIADILIKWTSKREISCIYVIRTLRFTPPV